MKKFYTGWGIKGHFSIILNPERFPTSDTKSDTFDETKI